MASDLVPSSSVNPVIESVNPVIEAIQRATRDPEMDVGRLRALCEYYAEIQFAQAFHSMSSELERVQQSATAVVGKGTRKYASYQDMDRVVKPLLMKHGFAVSFTTKPGPDGTGIITIATLQHILGHTRTAEAPLPADNSGAKNAAQAIGSAITYGRRYTLMQLLNLIPDDGSEDDGRAAGSFDTISTVQQDDLLIKLKQVYHPEPANISGFMVSMGYGANEPISAIRRDDFDNCMKQIDHWLAKRGHNARN